MEPKPQRIGVIDLGTNTFHLLIVEVHRNGWKKIFRERQFVKLASDGIETIGAAPFQRGIDTLTHFATVISKYEVSKVRAFGTAALRTASNGANFIEDAKLNSGIQVELIPGEKEAQLISEGVSLAVPNGAPDQMIMDVGGGSIEFILRKKGKVVWLKSFPLGVAVLHNNFHHSDPMNQDEILTLRSYLGEKLVTLKKAIHDFQPSQICGASGTFDVLRSLSPALSQGDNHVIIDINSVHELHDALLHTDLAERLAWPGLPKKRAELVVVALILIKSVLQMGNFESLAISKYALKEGMIQSMIRDL